MDSGSIAIPANQLLSAFAAVRRQTEALTEGLSAEDCGMQSMPETSPVKWHLAHTTWFFETFVLAPHAPGYQTFHPDFHFLFNSYYNAVGERPQRSNRGLLSRPSLQEVCAYRSHVDQAMSKLLENAAGAVAALAELGLNHEQQHQELIVTDIKHALWSNPLRPFYRQGVAKGDWSPPGPARTWLEQAGGLVSIGHSGEGFCYDNELPQHDVLLQPYKLSARLVTNREYLEFIRDGGYSRPELWLSDGWETVTNNSWTGPLYWEQRENEWWHYTTAGMFRLADELAAPVTHVSYYEADAYARWAGTRLATEFEWEAAASERSSAGDNFLEAGTFAPRPQSAVSLLGDVWQWTRSAYLPYPGYKPAPGALGEYNGKFMCNQMVLRGGSCATPRSHVRGTYRNFFPPQARWQFTGIRLAKDAA